VWDETFAGSELEDYLRVLQVAGRVPLYPWAVRALSPRTVDRLVRAAQHHPWDHRFAAPSDSATGLRWHLLRPSLTAYFNSTFPYGGNDGAVWQGRGGTLAVQAGVTARYGPVSLLLAPILFRAANRSFALRSTGFSDERRFADPLNPSEIDLPQRFGDGAYARLDPGQSTLRVDAAGVAVGLSTANEFWGPAVHMPIILGNNAAGFPRLFLGTADPIKVGIGRVHARVLWGRLSQSAFVRTDPDLSPRFASGIVATFTPRGIPGFELGYGRFFHSIWPEDTRSALSELTRPFGNVLKASSSDPNDQNVRERAVNQLASAFFRWVIPSSGFEFYGEYGREDANWNLRDLVLEPDHSSGYMLGLRKVWDDDGAGLTSLRGELLNTEVSRLEVVRPQTAFYRHVYLRQGHTEEGQLLGAYNGYGGGGAELALEQYRRWGGWTLFTVRDLVDHQAGSLGPGKPVDVRYSLGGKTLLLWNRYSVGAGVAATREQYRYLTESGFNLNFSLSVQRSF
jgi:hypothetical protein